MQVFCQVVYSLQAEKLQMYPTLPRGLNFHPAPYLTVFDSFWRLCLGTAPKQVTPFWPLNFAAVLTCVYPDLPCEFSHVAVRKEAVCHFDLGIVLIHCNSI